MDRAQLYAVLDDFLAALRARDPLRVSWAPGARHSENNVMLQPGDGVWATIDSLGSYDLRFADPVTGQVGWFGSVPSIRPSHIRTMPSCMRIWKKTRAAMVQCRTMATLE